METCTWSATVAPIVRTCETAAMIGESASWNAAGAKALGGLLSKMAYVNLPLNAAEDETMQCVRRGDGNKCLAFCDGIVSALIAQEEAREAVR